ncbi:MAG TPA: zinc ribbon domain-containing protein, partial [Candidatus Limnocylindrales bacterium]|nr:zinc ribbon domain-containing protein [Candidatus Limnocylindrales bacterium]
AAASSPATTHPDLAGELAAAAESPIEPVAAAPWVVEPEAEPAQAADVVPAADAAPVAGDEAPVAAESPVEIVATALPVEPATAAPTPVWPAPAPEPLAAEPPRDDRIQQPTWQIFAPDATPATDRPLDGAVPPAAPVQPPFAASADPQWPVRPDQADSPAMALLANRANRSPSDALWAASAQEVLARPASVPVAGAATGVQPCSSCGLSLSATARFCRRCGTRQG